MNKQKKILLTLGTLFALTALASGGEILELVIIELFVLSAFLLTVVFLKINWTVKLLIVVIFIATLILTLTLMDDIPYSENKLRINITSVVLPILTTSVLYWTFRSR